MNIQDQEVRKALTEISKTLAETAKPGLANEKLETLAKKLREQTTNLNNELANVPVTGFTYEFYSESSGVVEQITKLRMNSSLKSQINHLLDIFNILVSTIRQAVFKHNSFAGSHITESQFSTAKNTLESAQTYLKEATANAAGAAAEAEKANETGMEFIEKFHELNQKGQKICQDLADKSFEHTLTIFAKNAAAVLATDEAACALMHLNEIIEQEKKKLL